MIQATDDFRFITTVATGMDGVISIDEDQIIVLINKQAQNMFGYSEKEILGQPLERLLPPELAEKHKQHIKDFLTSGVSGRTMAERQVIHGRHAKGHNFHIEASISQSTYNSRRFCTVVLRDLTPLRKKQDLLEKSRIQLEQRVSSQKLALHNSNSRLNEVQRLSQTGIWELDINGNILYWSDEVYELFELDKNEFKASYDAFLETIHPEDRETVNNAYLESVKNKKPYQVRHRLLMSDGRTKYVEERCETFYNDSGDPVRSVGTIKDITTLVIADQQHRHLQKLLLRVETLAEIGSWEWNLDTNQVYWSPEMFRQYGIDPDKAPEPNFKLAVEAIYPEDRAKVQAVTKPTLTSGVLAPIEFRTMDSENNIQYLRVQGELVKKNDEEGRCLYGFSQDITKYVLAEQKAWESTQLFQAVFETTHMGVAFLDREFNFLRVNQAYADSDNKNPDYFIGKNHFALYPNKENEKIFQNALATGNPVTVNAKPFEYEQNPERGITHWDWSLTPLKSHSGTVDGLALTLIDVTERINAIEVSQKNEEKLRELNDNLENIVKERTAELVKERNFIDRVLETQGALVTVINRYGNIVMFNRACEDASGFSADEVKGKPIWDFVIPPEERLDIENVFHDLTESALPSQYQNHWLNKDGSRRLIDWSNSTITDNDGTVRYIIATGIDVTERRRTEVQLMRTSSSLQIAQRIAKVGSWEYEVEPEKLWWSEENYRIFGQTPENFTPSRENYLNLIHPKDLKSAELATDQLILQGYKDITLRIVKPGGDTRIVHETAEVEYNDNGEPTLLRGTVQDVTDIKRAEKERNQLQRQLQQAQKMESIGQLTGGIAHDFNNILSVILGFTDLAINRFASDEKDPLRNYLDEIKEAGTRASDLVKQMLAFSRGDKLSHTLLKPQPIIDDSIKMLRSTIPSSIDISNTAKEDNIIIETDGLQLQQAIINLIINSRDALSNKGNIEVSLKSKHKKVTECISCHKLFSGEYIAISVKDTGHGMNPDTASRIFEPFFTTKMVGQGTGMGLAMVHGFAHSSGGHIQVDTRPGHGMTITLYFPVPKADQKSSPDLKQPTSAPEEEYDSLPKNILVVDDEEPVVRLLGEYLQNSNFNVTSTTSSKEALQHLQSSPDKFDLLITDQTMPQLTGLELIQKVRKFNPGLPILLCTGYSDEVNETNAREKGASHYLLKPVNHITLINTVNNLLAQSKTS